MPGWILGPSRHQLPWQGLRQGRGWPAIPQHPWVEWAEGSQPELPEEGGGAGVLETGPGLAGPSRFHQGHGSWHLEPQTWATKGFVAASSAHGHHGLVCVGGSGQAGPHSLLPQALGKAWPRQ